MIRSFAFTTQGKLHSRDMETFLMPTLLGDTNLFLWVDLEAPSREELRMVLEEIFHFHPLSIEDCVSDLGAPKVEEYIPKDEDQFAPYLFIVIHGVDYSKEDGVFATSELNFFLGKNFLVTCHVKPVRSIQYTEEQCLRRKRQVARAPDRVAHTLLDNLVDNYKPALQELAFEIGEIEDQVLDRATPDVLNKITSIKKEVQHLRRIIGPQREVLSRFARGDFKLIRPKLIPYYRDVYDDLFRIHELAQNYTDSLTGVLQLYLNMSSNQTGEVVKLLTMITLITTPMMMIGTWYGMNFSSMPELSASNGYIIAAAVMLCSTAGTYLYFKRKKWL